MRGTPVASPRNPELIARSGWARRAGRRGGRTARLGARGPLCTALALTTLLACSVEAPDRPDLFLLTLDRVAADRLECFGGPAGEARDLCGLARGGTLFAWTVTAGRGEAATAATVHTGRPFRDHDVDDQGLRFLTEAQTTIAESLARAGYRTAAFVTSPRLNRSRRLDQGFGRYEDGFARRGPDAQPQGFARRSPDALPQGFARPGRDTRKDVEGGELARAIETWFARHPAPRFVWIHAGDRLGLDGLDRLVARLARPLGAGDGEHAPGILFAALQGAPAGRPSDDPIDWRSHRVALFWRPPRAEAARLPPASFRLARLEDIAPTLRAAARAGAPTEAPGAPPAPGVDLTWLARPPLVADDERPRFVLLESPDATSVGLASEREIYVRQASVYDGSGRPVPTDQLVAHAARFAPLPIPDPLRDPAPRSAALEPARWRTDVLDPASPVPRLEFHLARRLAVVPEEDTR